MKKRILATLMAAAMMMGCLAGCGGKPSGGGDTGSGGGDTQASSDQVFNLKIDYPNPENSAIYPVLVKWGEWLDEQSGGRIKVKVYAAGALGSIVDCVNNVEAGVTDGCWSAMNLYPGIWPLCDVFMLPMMGADSMESMNAAIQDMFVKDEFQDQFDNVKMVCIHSHTPSTFIYADSVKSMQDVKGKTVRTLSNYTTPWLSAMGAIPVSVSSNDGYENISKGVVDGGLWFCDQIQSSALYEVIKTCFYGETAYPCLFLCINKDVYESMPADLQQIIDDSREYYLSLLGEAYYSQEELVIQLLKDANVDLIYTSEEDLEWMRGYAPAAYDAFTETVNAMGYDGEAIIAQMQELLEKYNEEFAD